MIEKSTKFINKGNTVRSNQQPNQKQLCSFPKNHLEGMKHPSVLFQIGKRYVTITHKSVLHSLALLAKRIVFVYFLEIQYSKKDVAREGEMQWDRSGIPGGRNQGHVRGGKKASGQYWRPVSTSSEPLSRSVGRGHCPDGKK